ncbi:MAG: D-alanine--D-alanine ligase [Gammaproteobacteria bacterium]|nr:D-alanine--D-alanine ligase [Gammaproteobacteria bacterium]MCP5137233.1 D-alanine--D-alanine ligase [Gammaproteobacteria bacterium]
MSANAGKVALLYGGISAEREVSLKSGKQVLAALQRRGVAVTAIDCGPDSLAPALRQLEKGGFDRVFNVLHGRGGEDGVIQGALDALEIAYTGSGVLGSALGMDKVRCKQIWKARGLPTPDYHVVNSAEECDAVVQDLGLPLFVKPALEGSSIGTSRVDNAEQLVGAWAEAAKHDSPVLVERCITGGEYTCAILGVDPLPLIKLEAEGAFYDYEAKYLSDRTRYLCPCGLPEALETQFQAICTEAFRAVGAGGWGRVDFMLDADGRLWLLEVNTVPGMTDHSLVPMAARQAGIDFDELVFRILMSAQRGGS